MGLTRIKTGQSYVIFAQPAIGSNVTIRIDTQIAWINEGYHVHIPKGGIYEVVSVVAFNVTLKLIKKYAEQGEIVGVDVIHPVARERKTYWKHYNYISGESQVFDIEHSEPEMVRVLVNGVGLDPSQYNVEELTPSGTVEILDELSNADYIDIYYEK